MLPAGSTRASSCDHPQTGGASVTILAPDNVPITINRAQLPAPLSTDYLTGGSPTDDVKQLSTGSYLVTVQHMTTAFEAILIRPNGTMYRRTCEGARRACLATRS